MFRHCTQLNCPHCPSYTKRVCFLGTIICTDAEVGGFLIFGYGGGMEKNDGVGALAGNVCFTAAVKEATNFTSVGFLPSFLAGLFA